MEKTKIFNEKFIKENLGDIKNFKNMDSQIIIHSKDSYHWYKEKNKEALIEEAFRSKLKQNNIKEELKMYKNILNSETYSYLKSVIELEISPVQENKYLTEEESIAISELKIYDKIIDYFTSDGILKVIRTKILPNYKVDIKKDFNNSELILYSDQIDYEIAKHNQNLFSQQPEIRILTLKKGNEKTKILLEDNFYATEEEIKKLYKIARKDDERLRSLLYREPKLFKDICRSYELSQNNILEKRNIEGDFKEDIKKELDIQHKCTKIIEDFLGLTKEDFDNQENPYINATRKSEKISIKKTYEKSIGSKIKIYKSKNYY